MRRWCDDVFEIDEEPNGGNWIREKPVNGKHFTYLSQRIWKKKREERIWLKSGTFNIDAYKVWTKEKKKKRGKREDHFFIPFLFFSFLKELGK